MDWSSATPAIFSLLGAAVGATTSFLGTYFATRTTKEKARAEQQAALRAERKELILKYLELVQEIQVFTNRRWHHPDDLGDQEVVRQQAILYGQQIWLLHKHLQLVASRSLCEASEHYTKLIDDALWVHPDDARYWSHVEPAQSRYLEAARSELMLGAEVAIV